LTHYEAAIAHTPIKPPLSLPLTANGLETNNKMKFFAQIIAFVALAGASFALGNSTDPSSRCVEKCANQDVSCVARCLNVPAPTTEQVTKTNNCVQECHSKFVNDLPTMNTCVTDCTEKNFFPSVPSAPKAPNAPRQNKTVNGAKNGTNSTNTTTPSKSAAGSLFPVSELWKVSALLPLHLRHYY